MKVAYLLVFIALVQGCSTTANDPASKEICDSAAQIMVDDEAVEEFRSAQRFFVNKVVDIFIESESELEESFPEAKSIIYKYRDLALPYINSFNDKNCLRVGYSKALCEVYTPEQVRQVYRYHTGKTLQSEISTLDGSDEILVKIGGILANECPISHNIRNGSKQVASELNELYYKYYP